MDNLNTSLRASDITLSDINKKYVRGTPNRADAHIKHNMLDKSAPETIQLDMPGLSIRVEMKDFIPNYVDHFCVDAFVGYEVIIKLMDEGRGDLGFTCGVGRRVRQNGEFRNNCYVRSGDMDFFAGNLATQVNKLLSQLIVNLFTTHCQVGLPEVLNNMAQIQPEYQAGVRLFNTGMFNHLVEHDEIGVGRLTAKDLRYIGDGQTAYQIEHEFVVTGTGDLLPRRIKATYRHELDNGEYFVVEWCNDGSADDSGHLPSNPPTWFLDNIDNLLRKGY